MSAPTDPVRRRLLCTSTGNVSSPDRSASLFPSPVARRIRIAAFVFFTAERSRLLKRFAEVSQRLSPAGGLWISWPKRASGVVTDLTEDVVRLIGLKLSQKYRFAEGAPLQRRALSFDQEFLPAKLQLAQDLLRLGEEAEGWRFADEVYQRDAYDATSYNLVTLHDSFRKFQALTNADFIVRMSASRAGVDGSARHVE